MGHLFQINLSSEEDSDVEDLLGTDSEDDRDKKQPVKPVKPVQKVGMGPEIIEFYPDS